LIVKLRVNPEDLAMLEGPEIHPTRSRSIASEITQFGNVNPSSYPQRKSQIPEKSHEEAPITATEGSSANQPNHVNPSIDDDISMQVS
jgi:hypothetical protein